MIARPEFVPYFMANLSKSPNRWFSIAWLIRRAERTLIWKGPFGMRILYLLLFCPSENFQSRTDTKALPCNSLNKMTETKLQESWPHKNKEAVWGTCVSTGAPIWLNRGIVDPIPTVILNIEYWTEARGPQLNHTQKSFLYLANDIDWDGFVVVPLGRYILLFVA